MPWREMRPRCPPGSSSKLWLGARQMVYAPTATGLAPTQRSRIRSLSVLCYGKAGVRPCPTSLLHLGAKAEDDIDIAYPKQQVEHWMRIWTALKPDDKVLTRKAWRLAFLELSALAPHLRWRRAISALSATICVLLDLGWDACAPPPCQGELESRAATTLVLADPI